MYIICLQDYMMLLLKLFENVKSKKPVNQTELLFNVCAGKKKKFDELHDLEGKGSLELELMVNVIID